MRAITQQLQKETLESLSQTRGMVQKGELIVAKGSVINQDVYQKLESYKKAFEDNAHVTGNKNMVLLGQFLLVFFNHFVADYFSVSFSQRYL